ncbi:unnamed protein product [Cochlearia groenlandica]
MMETNDENARDTGDGLMEEEARNVEIMGDDVMEDSVHETNEEVQKDEEGHLVSADKEVQEPGEEVQEPGEEVQGPGDDANQAPIGADEGVHAPDDVPANQSSNDQDGVESRFQPEDKGNGGADKTPNSDKTEGNPSSPTHPLFC